MPMIKNGQRLYKRTSWRYFHKHVSALKRRVDVLDAKYDKLLLTKGNEPPLGVSASIPHYPGGWRGQVLVVDVIQTRMRKLGRCMRGNLK